MTEEEFLRIRDYLKLRYGIDMNHKKTIVEGRLEIGRASCRERV